MKELDQHTVNDWVKRLTAKWQSDAGKLFIQNEFVASSAGKTFATKNPANQETLRQVAQGNAADIDRAVQAARRAYLGKDWRQMKPAKRAELIHRLGDLVREHALELAVTESLDNGKTIQEALRADLPSVTEIFHYYAGWTTKIQGETIPVNGPFLNYTLREPMGVCGQIIPWNYPLLMAAWKLAPALACGNTVVLKPAEQTPLTALRLAELCLEAGFPPGVINIVTGYGEEAGAALAEHTGVDKVAFTGSTEVGRKILAASAKTNLKRVSLELGGKSPQIIFADADIKQALKHAFYGIFFNKGEVCSAGSRLFVEKQIYDSFCTELVNLTKTMKVGTPQDLTTTLGAIVTEEQMSRVLGYIEKGRSSAAKLAVGGQRVSAGDLGRGNFVEPTIFLDVSPQDVIAQEEIFGPVLAVLPCQTEDEVIEKANASMYGLAASVWTRDIARAHRVAHALQAGTVWINTYNGFDAASPFGGYKQSGFGREMGAHALELYTQVKSIWVNLK